LVPESVYIHLTIYYYYYYCSIEMKTFQGNLSIHIPLCYRLWIDISLLHILSYITPAILNWVFIFKFYYVIVDLLSFTFLFIHSFFIDILIFIIFAFRLWVIIPLEYFLRGMCPLILFFYLSFSNFVSIDMQLCDSDFAISLFI
jgi:hypothetical protein